MRRKKRLLCALLAYCIIVASLPMTASAETTGAFPDVPVDADYAEAVAVLAEMKIITGDSKGNFNPNNTITRAEAAAIICHLMGVDEEIKPKTETSFKDVPASHWASGYVAKGVEMGIFSGYGNGKFGPSDPVTYKQMVKMLVSARGYDDAALAEGGWPNGYLSYANTLDFLTGVTEKPNGQIDRANVAKMIFNSMS